MKSILDLSDGDWDAWVSETNVPRYRVAQIREWIFQRRSVDFADMTNLPKTLREQLARGFTLWTSHVVTHQRALDGTEKLLLRLERGGEVECVLIRQGRRRTACVSSQVGCAMGCVFCASGLNGVERNLTAGEIVEQLLQLQQRLPASERLSHIVMMGMGEPLANLSSVLQALEVATAPEGMGISPRRITISTVGLPPAMDRLAADASAYRLAISLHAPNDALRNELVPVNRQTGLAEILAAADRFVAVRHKRITFEYVLLADVNDRVEHVQELVGLLQHRKALLNVIPYNPVAGLVYRTPSEHAVATFRRVLEEGGVNVQFRERKGDAINAACGQLRRNFTALPLAPVTGDPL